MLNIHININYTIDYKQELNFLQQTITMTIDTQADKDTS